MRAFSVLENAANCVGAWITYGVRKIKSSSRELLATLRLKKFPRKGISPRIGIFCSVEDLSRCIRPPMTTVCPLGVMATVLAAIVSMTGAFTPEAMGTVVVESMAEVCGATIISTMPSLVI